MVLVLPEVESFGSKFSKSLGQGFSKGYSEAESYRNKLKSSDKKKDLYPVLNSYLKSKGVDLTHDEFIKIYPHALKYQDEGLDEPMSVAMALKDFNEGKLEPTFSEKLKSEPVKDESKGANQGLKGFEDSKRSIAELPDKEIFQLSEEQLRALPREEKLEYFKRKRDLSEGAIGHGILSALTIGGFDKLAQKAAPEYSEKSMREQGYGPAISAGEMVGSVIPFTAAYKYGGKVLDILGKNTKAGRALMSSIITGGHRAIEDKVKNGTVEPGDVGLAALFGAGGQVVLEHLPFLGKFVKDTASKIKGAFKGPQVKERLLLDYALKEVAQSGVPIEALQKGEPQAVEKFKEILSDVTQLPPSILSEKIGRMYGESNLQNLTRRAQVIEDQINYSKKTRRLAEEIAEEEGRLAERDKPVAKREGTIAKENALKAEAEKELPHAVERYRSLSKSLGEAKDNFNFLRKIKAPIEQLEQSRNVIDRLTMLNEDAHEIVKGINYQKNLGKTYRSVREQEIEAINDIANLEHKVATRPENEIFRPDSRQEYVAKIKGRREIPGTNMLKPDTQSRLRNVRIEEYENKIKQLKQRKMNAPLEQKAKLDKAIDIAEKLLQQNKEYLKVHERRRALQDISKTLKRQEKIKTAELVKEDKKVRDIINRTVKNPNEKNIKHASEALYGKEEADKIDAEIDTLVEEAGKESKEKFDGTWENIKQKTGSKESPFSTKKPNGKSSPEEQKSYVNFLNLAHKILKGLGKVRTSLGLATFLLSLGGVTGITPKSLWQNHENKSEAEDYNKLADHKKLEARSNLKKKYSAARYKKIMIIAENL